MRIPQKRGQKRATLDVVAGRERTTTGNDVRTSEDVVSQGVGKSKRPSRSGPCEWKPAAGADIKVSQKQVHAIRSMKLESQRYGSLLVESYHGNIRDRTGQKSKVKKEHASP